MKKCSNCINDKSVRKINFNKDNVCNYCQSFKKIESKLNDYNNLEKLFKERIDKIKGKYDYDVAVGVSGGKDSMFVLYELVNKYHLKVKTFTLNNGFLSDEAKKNIDKMIKEFGVEHEYIEFDKEILKKFYRYSMKKWLVPCMACSYIGYATMINYTTKINAGMCIHGRSPEQMLRYFGNDIFTVLVEAGLKSINDININQLYNELLKSIEDKVDKNLMKDVKEMLFKDIKENDFREFVSYFLYHEYNEKKIVNFLQENTSWQVDKNYNHYDCLIHNAAKYIYQCAEGRPHILPEISVLVRSKKMSKQEAEENLKNAVILKKPIKELNLLCNFVNLNQNYILFKAKLYNKVIKK